jgi:hypothetical protein
MFYTLLALFCKNKQLQCAIKLNVERMKLIQEEEEKTDFPYSYQDEVEWFIYGKGGEHENDYTPTQDEKSSNSKVRESNFDLGNESLKDKGLKLKHAVSKFALFTALYFAAAHGSVATCQAILMYNRHHWGKGVSTLIQIPDEVIEISGAGHIDANGIYAKLPTYSETGNPNDGLTHSKSHEHPLTEVQNHHNYGCDVCHERIVDGCCFTCEQCSYDLCMKCFNKEKNQETVYTQVYNKKYRLKFSDMSCFAGDSGWTSVNDDSDLYKVVGRKDVSTIVFGSWLACGGTLPAPVAAVSELKLATIFQEKLVCYLQFIFEFNNFTALSLLTVFFHLQEKWGEIDLEDDVQATTNSLLNVKIWKESSLFPKQVSKSEIFSH